MRRVLAALVITATALPVPARAAVPILVIEGRGFGHGVGMAQDGALSMGRGGASTEQILSQFYPGTKSGRSRGVVRVPVLEAAPTRPGGRASAPIAAAVVSMPNGGEIRDSPSGGQGPGFPLRVPPGREARIVLDKGRYRAELVGSRSLGRIVLASTRRQLPPIEPPPAPTPPEPPPATTPVPGDPLPPPPGKEPAPPTAQPEAPPAPVSTRPLWAVPADGGTVSLPARQRRYRGMIEATASGAGLRLVNQVDVEQYLKGMGEVLDPSWPAASLRAQAIAARTYALRAMAASGEVCETQRCQVYLGAQVEYAAMNKAVDATSSHVLLFGGSLASAVYSANGGGFSASAEEGFGTPGPSYLRPAAYPTKDPFPWSLTVALRDVRGRFGYPGQLTGARITRTGPSGRALEVTLDGSAGPRTVSGIAFDAGLGLRSTLFSLRVDVGEAPPPPPSDDGAVLQSLPGDPAAGVEAALAEGAPATAAAPAPVAGSTGITEGPQLAATVVAAWSLLAVGGLALVLQAWRPPGRAPARPEGRAAAAGPEGPGLA